MRTIPTKIRKKIDEDPFYKRCCVTGSLNVSIEHCWTYAGKQINELWALVPLRRDLNISHPPRWAKEQCRLISLLRATPEDLAKYPRVNWAQELKYLSNKHPEILKKWKSIKKF